MTEQAILPGLWPIPGDGVLARQGDLVLLIHPAGGAFTDRLLSLLTEVARTGGDGLRFTGLVSAEFDNDAVAADPSAGQPGPAVVAFGPAGPGTAIAVYGVGWADVTTGYGPQRLTTGQPYGRLRSVLPSPATAISAGVQAAADGGETDPYMRLADGMVRAVGLVFAPAGAGGEPAAVPAQAALAQPGDAEPADGSADHIAPDIAGYAAPDGGAPDAGLGAPAAAIPMPGSAEPALEPSGAAAPEPALEPASAAQPEPFSEPPRTRRPDPSTSPPGSSQPSPRRPPPNRSCRRCRAPAAWAAAWTRPSRACRAMRCPAMASSTWAPKLRASSTPTPKLRAPSTPARAICPPRCPPSCRPRSRPPSWRASSARTGTSTIRRRGTAPSAGIGLSPSASTQQGMRPPLGALILDDGSMCQLDADCIIGREPTLDSAVAEGRARPLRVTDASGVVSRMHARVELEGWQAFITDLHSANGTQILRPGDRHPTSLEPGTRVPLPGGTQIRLGGEFGLEYDAHRHA